MSQTLLYLELIIRYLGHLALDQSNKTLSISNLDILNFYLCQFSWAVFPWAVFFDYLKLFRKFLKPFAIFLLILDLFELPMAQLLQ